MKATCLECGKEFTTSHIPQKPAVRKLNEHIEEEHNGGGSL